MSISISNNSYDYSMIVIKGVELEKINRVVNTSKSKAVPKINKTGELECQTCKDRKYQDVSNDPGTSVCPEFGKSYVSGEQTRTVTKSTNEGEKNDYFITNYNDTIAKNYGLVFDIRV